jgi:hypothetical protein
LRGLSLAAAGRAAGRTFDGGLAERAEDGPRLRRTTRAGGRRRPGYIRESIIEPSAHLVPGAMFSANGVSFMPATYGDSLSDEQIDQLVAFLGSLR